MVTSLLLFSSRLYAFVCMIRVYNYIPDCQIKVLCLGLRKRVSIVVSPVPSSNGSEIFVLTPLAIAQVPALSNVVAIRIARVNATPNYSEHIRL